MITPVPGKPEHFVDADGEVIMLSEEHTKIVRVKVTAGGGYKWQMGEHDRVYPLRISVVPESVPEPLRDPSLGLRLVIHGPKTAGTVFEAAIGALIDAHRAVYRPTTDNIDQLLKEFQQREVLRERLVGARLPGTRIDCIIDGAHGHVLEVCSDVTCIVELEMVLSRPCVL